jgi:cytochrome c peroxidase
MRVPTLRNVALTAPYMHDGSVATLDAVIEHYAAAASQRLDPQRLDPRIQPLHLSAQEKHDLVAFLESLTDQEFAAKRGPGP